MQELDPNCVCPNCFFKWTSVYLSGMRIEMKKQQNLLNQQNLLLFFQKNLCRENILKLEELLSKLEKL